MDIARRPEAEPQPRDSLVFTRQGRPFRTTFERVFSRFGGGGGGGAAASFESVAKNLSAENAVLTYSGGDLVSVAYANGITKTLNYSGGNLVSIVLSGATPGGIDLRKTLSYSGGNLTGISYS